MNNKYFKESIELKKKILNQEVLLNKCDSLIRDILIAFKKGNKLIIAGNGGSAADAQHFAAELVGRYKLERKGLPAIALTTDSSIITAWSNDYSFDTIFSRQIEALGQEGDIFIGLSTSGNSKNIIEALKTAKEMDIKTICLLGKDGGKAKDLADIALIVPSENTPRIQEIHILFIHIICEELEKDL